jgi:hypothetical protein
MEPQGRPASTGGFTDAVPPPAPADPGRYADTDRTAHRLAVAGVLTVAAVAAVVSYQHAHEVAVRVGESALSAVLLPLSVDGAVLAGSMGLLADSRAGRPASRLAWCLLGLGAVATLGANVAAAEPNVLARVVAAWPAVAFVWSVETLLSMIRRAGFVEPKYKSVEPKHKLATNSASAGAGGGVGGPGGVGSAALAPVAAGTRPQPAKRTRPAKRVAPNGRARSDTERLAEIRARGLEGESLATWARELQISKTTAQQLRRQLEATGSNGHGGSTP